MSTTSTTQIPTGTWHVDPVHSTIGFEVKHIVSTFRGRFEAYDATLTVDDGGDAKLVGTVDVSSLKVKDENLQAHLTSPEFFDTERFGQLRFESIRVDVDSDQLAIEGDLTIRDTTKRVEGRGTVGAAAEDPFGNTHLGLSLKTTVNRNDFGLTWQMDLPNGGKVLGDDVTLVVELELVKGA